MTTIVVTADMMAADTRVDEDGVGTHAAKLFVCEGAIIGGAGDNEAIMRFLEWWPARDTVPLRIPKRFAWNVLVLSNEGILLYNGTNVPDVCREDWAAIGTGSVLALAAMDTMRLLGRKPDPRVAVKVACKRDSLTGGDVEFVRLTKKMRGA